MIATLPNHITAPPGSWRYKVPETGQLFNGPSEHSLISQLQAHYKANGYPIPSSDELKPRIEAFICSTVPDYCTGNEPAKPVDGFSFHTVIYGTKTLSKWLIGSLFKGERQFVSSQQANARASVCTMCNLNEAPQGCTGCNSGALKAAVSTLIGNRSTPFDDRLKSCRVCNCLLSAKVHLPHLVLWDNMPDAQKVVLPEHCWLIKESLQ